MKNKLKLLRENFGFTQDQLATLVDVSRQTIISLEREKYDPSIQLAFKLSNIFSCTIEDIFIFKEEN
ncbi:helix-turn-helix transcriptional regulator [Clostridium bowmanii]|uniref:helix-turn-helix transcriptional regulator n=1 Tax=Clostridium bowmanii TaxID=132925 RepID=UPI001C0B6EB8|nr:helix-turn-helix transcriptional regulator [Clostridium bowmanii]MBU3188709.1 helix-turn-helix transcriptional regulator [Clostridium bowmanii]MCA1073294.1 helix-turn-helix transcriptional regulator [Clostridium bowmanii]